MKTELSCTMELLVQAVDKCEFVKTVCNSANYFDFYYLRFCRLANLPGQNYIFLGLSGLIILTSFYFLGNIAEKFLSSSLSLMSKRLKLSEAVAGVTILAFANGAPDIVASFTAGGEEDTGIFISVGSLFGGCCFASTIVLGLCVLYSKTGIYVGKSADLDGGRILASRHILLHGVCSIDSHLRIHRQGKLLDGCGLFRPLLGVASSLSI